MCTEFLLIFIPSRSVWISATVTENSSSELKGRIDARTFSQIFKILIRLINKRFSNFHLFLRLWHHKPLFREVFFGLFYMKRCIMVQRSSGWCPVADLVRDVLKRVADAKAGTLSSTSIWLCSVCHGALPSFCGDDFVNSHSSMSL